MTPHLQTKKRSIELQVPLCEADDPSPPRSPDSLDQEGPHLQDIVGEIRELVGRSITNGDACVKSLNEFGSSVANWNRQIFEQHVSDQKLQHELIATTQKLVNARIALQQETATCDALRREFTVEKDKSNEMAAQLKICREANLTIVRVVCELSQALCTATTPPTVVGG